VDQSDATDREEVDFKDEKVKTHREGDGTKKPIVAPRRHHQQRLILWNTTTCWPRQLTVTTTGRQLSYCLYKTSNSS